MGDDDYSSLEIEIETLKAIYIHELEVKHDERGRPNSVIVHLYPATADNVTEQFVRLSLILQIPSEYPQDVPDISIRNTRGLSDEEIESIYQATQTLAEERKGNAMLFELIEVAKEHLTGINIPSCECAICLYGFVKDDVLTKTDCFHYFHSHCLARYVRHTLKGKKDANDDTYAEDHQLDTTIACPVCRLPVSFSLSDKKFPPPAESENVDLSISMEQRKLQEEMQELFFKQKEKGGIIDLEAERNKFLIEISTVPDSASSNDSVETTNQQIEHKESRVENLLKSQKVSSETASEGEENSDGKNRNSKLPPTNQHKQHGNKNERYVSIEKSSEGVSSTKENSDIQQNKSSVRNEIHSSDAVSDVQETEVIAQSGHSYNRTMQRSKMSYQGPNKRHFRGNHYPRQQQSRDRHSYVKNFQSNQYECKDNTESYSPKQLPTDLTVEGSNTDIDRVYFREDSSEINATERDKQPKPSRVYADVYRENRSKYFGKNSKKQQLEEYYREKKNECFKEESDFVKKLDTSTNTEKGDRQHFSGKYSRNYRNEQQRHRYDFQREERMKNTQNGEYKFQDKNADNQNTDYESPRRDNKTINHPQYKDMSQNQNRSSEPNMEDFEYHKRDRNSDNGNRKFNATSGLKLEHNRNTSSGGRKFRQNSARDSSDTGDHCWTDSRRYTNDVSLQEMKSQKIGRQTSAEVNESETEDSLQVLSKESERNKKEERFRNTNSRGDNNNYRGNYNNHGGYRNRANNRQYRHSYEDRANCSFKSSSEQENFKDVSCRNQTQIASKNKMNKEISEPSSSVPETTVQLDLKFSDSKYDNASQPSKDKDCEEIRKHTNVSYSYRGRSRGRRGFGSQSNERNRYIAKDGDGYKGESRETQSSTNLILAETGEENILSKGNGSGNNIAQTVQRTGLSKSTKHRNLYFYPKSRGNYRRTSNEANYYTQERHRYSKGSNNLHSSNSKVEAVDTVYETEAEKLPVHR